MDLSVVFLGTGGSVPTARRSTACLLVRRGGDRILIDCGEGAQRQMARSTGLVEVDDIFLTHLHADHYLGIPGLLKTYDLHSRERPLRIFGPPGLVDLFGALSRIVGRTRYELELVELSDGDEIAYEDGGIHAFPVQHRIRSFGYSLVEHERPGVFDPDAARALGISPGPDFGRLQAGETIVSPGGQVAPEQVMGPSRAGRKVVVTGDTVPCEETRVAAAGAELLVHDASFSAEEADRAVETGHSTAEEAARLAAEAGVGMLALVHISTRYHVGRVCDEATAIFERTIAPRDFDVVEIPFPERGEPRHVRDGARSGTEAPAPEPAAGG